MISMSPFTSIFLGVLQGLTEFLPVSSSGHLAIAQSLLPGFSQPGVLFDVLLHAGTLLSVVVYFRKEILHIRLNYVMLIIVGTIPAVIFGFLFKDFFESLFSNIKLVGFALLITAAMNYFTDKSQTKKHEISYSDSLIVGMFQAFAIIPGISRSGSTIFSGVKRGIGKKDAAEFSFLLSVPAVFGANVLEILGNSGDKSVPVITYLLGFLAALVSGYFAIRLVFQFLAKKNFRIFAYYAFLLGLSTLVL